MSALGGEFGFPDAVMLTDISEDGFVNNVALRYSKGKMYSYIGEVLISVNPYKELNIYTDAILQEHRGKAIYQREPHVFALAETMYATMKRNESDVCVVISGESGAGKTEASKHIMKYVAGVSSGKHAAEINRVKDMLLASNPLLEAFGNAKTLRNDNSSRFGKYMDINFDFTFAPVGGHINNYLLEKARVVKQQQGERNFHIFYQILAGADDSLLKQFKLDRDASKFYYLSQGGAAKVAGLDDNANYKAVQKAVKDIGFPAQLFQELQQIVAAVIYTGQVEFTAAGSGCALTDASVGTSLASLFGVDAAELNKALTNRVVAARGEVFVTQLTVDAAVNARDALAKAVYDRLFSYLVKRINGSLSQKISDKNITLGVLDIYGFEIFPNNGFEQFCINYCNEKLQQLFIELVMKREQEEYAREGIDWVDIKYFDNSIICKLVDSNPKGIICVLDEQCQRPNGTDAAFLAHLDTVMKGEDRYSSKQKDPSDACERLRDFRIKHFAGDVVYNTNGFVDKNTDTFFQDLKRLLYGSSIASLKEMWPEGADAITEVHKMPATAATTFRVSMDQLVVLLEKKEPFYVRCIKPNSNKSASEFDRELVVHQVRYLGLLENLRVRRAGFCDRQIYATFVERYKMLCKKTWPKYKGQPQDAAKLIISEMKMDKEVAFGKTKLFVKEPKTLFALEEARERTIPLLVSKIQARYKGVLQRRRYKKLRAAYRIVSYWHKSKIRSVVTALVKRFQGVASLPDLGKSLTWPEPVAGTQEFVLYCKKIHCTWRAKTILARYKDPAVVEDIKKKILASDMLGGRRKFWGYQYTWQGNYLAKSAAVKEKFGLAVSQLCEKNGDKKVVFSSNVLKLNSKGKQDERALIITDKFIYKLDQKTFKPHKAPPIPLGDVISFGISSDEDQAIVIKSKEGDSVLCLQGEACCAELISIVAQTVGKNLPVEVDGKLQIKQQGKEKNLSFTVAPDEQLPKTTFQKRNSGFALVTRRASMMNIQERRGRKGPAGGAIAE